MSNTRSIPVADDHPYKNFVINATSEHGSGADKVSPKKAAIKKRQDALAYRRELAALDKLLEADYGY